MGVSKIKANAVCGKCGCIHERSDNALCYNCGADNWVEGEDLWKSELSSYVNDAIEATGLSIEKLRNRIEESCNLKE